MRLSNCILFVAAKYQLITNVVDCLVIIFSYNLLLHNNFSLTSISVLEIVSVTVDEYITVTNTHRKHYTPDSHFKIKSK